MNVALILSGGTGTRVGGDLPKQYITVGEKPVIAYSLERCFSHAQIDAVQIVAAPAWQEFIAKRCAVRTNPKFRGFSLPGKTRQLSVLNGLKDIRRYADADSRVLIHDAARPLLPSGLITACMEAAQGHGGVLPVLPMKDTIYISEDGARVLDLAKRSHYYAGQAPEVFILEPYYQANIRLLPDAVLQIHGSAEPAVLAGMDVVMIPGDERNFKITTAADLERFRYIVEERKNVRSEMDANTDRRDGAADESMGTA